MSEIHLKLKHMHLKAVKFSGHFCFEVNNNKLLLRAIYSSKWKLHFIITLEVDTHNITKLFIFIVLLIVWRA